MRDAYRVVAPLSKTMENMDNFEDVLMTPPERHTNEKSLADKFKDVAGGALGLGSSLATSLVNNALAQRNAREQRAWQEKMWQLQNEYNTPGAMADRMKTAGLNPYSMTGAQPAGSAGQGAMAQTMPVESPLAALKTYSDIKLTNATTGKTETETEKLLLEMDALDLAYQRGLLEFEDYKREFYKKWKYFEDNDTSPTQVATEHTISETKRNNAQAGLFEQQVLESEQQVRNLIAEGNYTDALTASENYFREYRAKLMEAQTDTERERAKEAMANAVRAYAEADFAEANTTYLRHKNSREAAQHAMNLSMDRLRKQGMITENECAEYKLKIDKAWDEGFFGDDAKGHRFENLATMWNSFLHHNLSLSGSGSVSSSASKLIK